MSVSVVIPFRGQPEFDGDTSQPERHAALAYVQQWWRREHSDWELCIGYLPADRPWVKATAVANGLTHATGDILVISDADVWSTGVDYAVEVVTAGAPWCVPHQRVNRLNLAATAGILAGGPLPSLREGHPHPDIEESYTGLEGGGMVVLPRTTYDRIPLDPRFVGWSLEDCSWALALKLLAGVPPRRSPADLWHLWHPPQDRRDRAVGSPASLALYERYLLAARYPDEMRSLLAEFEPVV